MDIVTMAMAKPKKIKLSDFIMEDGTNFGSFTENLIVNAMLGTLESGSYVSHETAKVPGFWDYVGKREHLYIQLEVSGLTYEAPLSIARSDGGYIGAVSFTVGFASNGIYVNTEMMFMRNGDGVDIVVKMMATPIS